MGYTSNIYSYMKNANAFISHLVGDPGFVLIESICVTIYNFKYCKNGPSEFLENGKEVFFESNKDNALRLNKFLITKN